MKITIVAATGGVGRHILAQAVDAGHDVTAVARNPAKLPADILADKAARAVAADLATPDPQVLESAVAGADAVLSALGPHSNADAGIAAPGTVAIVTAMRAAGVRRIVAISAVPVATTPSPGHPDPSKHDPGDGFFIRHLWRADRQGAVRQGLRRPGREWRMCCAIPASTGPSCGAATHRQAVHQHLPHRRRAERPLRRSVPRADVAHCMLAVLGQPATIGQIIGIATQLATEPAHQRTRTPEMENPQ